MTTASHVVRAYTERFGHDAHDWSRVHIGHQTGLVCRGHCACGWRGPARTSMRRAQSDALQHWMTAA